jgi:hypothetical protein
LPRPLASTREVVAGPGGRGGGAAALVVELFPMHREKLPCRVSAEDAPATR